MKGHIYIVRNGHYEELLLCLGEKKIINLGQCRPFRELYYLFKIYNTVHIPRILGTKPITDESCFFCSLYLWTQLTDESQKLRSERVFVFL